MISPLHKKFYLDNKQKDIMRHNSELLTQNNFSIKGCGFGAIASHQSDYKALNIWNILNGNANDDSLQSDSVSHAVSDSFCSHHIHVYIHFMEGEKNPHLNVWVRSF